MLMNVAKAVTAFSIVSFSIDGLAFVALLLS